MDDLARGLGERLREVRRRRDWTQAELAEKVGATPSQISSYEGGKVAPSAGVLLTLAQALGVSADMLLGNQVEARAADAMDDHALLETFRQAGTLDERDRRMIDEFVRALVVARQVQRIAGRADAEAPAAAPPQPRRGRRRSTEER